MHPHNQITMHTSTHTHTHSHIQLRVLKDKETHTKTYIQISDTKNSIYNWRRYLFNRKRVA